MDRMIYLAMTGAKQLLYEQDVVAQNLAKASTTGYRAETSAFRAVPVFGPGAPTRSFVEDSTPGSDFAPAPLEQTGRPLDVALQGEGWIAVQRPDGSEAYTRDGSLRVSANGVLQTRSGLNVLGDGGPLSVPPDAAVTIGGDGTVSVIPPGTQPSAIAAVGRIKLVNPDPSQLVRGGDGLFSLQGGGAAPSDSDVKLVSGALEDSNVNVVEAMVSMIDLARQFDMQMKLLSNAAGNAREASQIFNVTA